MNQKLKYLGCAMAVLLMSFSFPCCKENKKHHKEQRPKENCCRPSRSGKDCCFNTKPCKDYENFYQVITMFEVKPGHDRKVCEAINDCFIPLGKKFCSKKNWVVSDYPRQVIVLTQTFCTYEDAQCYLRSKCLYEIDALISDDICCRPWRNAFHPACQY